MIDIKEKIKWGDGPWLDEPDRKVWVDAETDLVCIAVRHDNLGHWCGYVGVPMGHLAYGLSYNGTLQTDENEHHKAWRTRLRESKGDIDKFIRELGPHPEALKGIGEAVRNIDVHGGLTFTGEARGDVCIDGTDDRFYFGFDCAHAFDLAPGMAAMSRSTGFNRSILDRSEVYRDLPYVEKECASLAKQLAALKALKITSATESLTARGQSPPKN